MSEVEQETAFEFPCQFPIKAMGKNTGELLQIVTEIVARHADDVHPDIINARPSKGDKFLSITITVEAQSKAQLDAIYMDLTACVEVMITM